MDRQLERQLKQFLRGTVCVLGIGNRNRKDDGLGSRIAESLESCPGMNCVNAGWVPENHFGSVARMHPDTILLIDAADFGGAPGQARLLDPHAVSSSGLSSHTTSLHMLADYLRARTHARVALLAVQPLTTGPGEGLSREVELAVEDLVRALPAICHRVH